MRSSHISTDRVMKLKTVTRNEYVLPIRDEMTVLQVLHDVSRVWSFDVDIVGLNFLGQLINDHQVVSELDDGPVL